jgi:hypothetical protein
MTNIATSVATTTVANIPETVSFWHHLVLIWQQTPDLPAAAYVLIGVIISGFFSFFSDKRNIKNSRELKELENKNSRELKELENKNSREFQELENAHREKLQTTKEKGDKSLRLLDDRLKVFTDFHNNYSEILNAGSDKNRVERIGNLRKDAFKIRLLASSAKDDLERLDTELVDFGNFYFELTNGERKLSAEEKLKEAKKYRDRIDPLFNKISDALVNNL